MSMWNSLKDVIEGIIRIRYFRHFIEAVDNARNDERHKHNRRSESPREGQRVALRKEIREICTIFGGPHIAGSLSHTQDRYEKEAQIGPTIVVTRTEERSNKATRRESKVTTFTERNARWVHHPLHDALVITAKVGNNNVHRMLVDNGSATNILYLNAFNKMGYHKNT